MNQLNQKQKMNGSQMRDQDLERTRAILRAWGNWSSNNTGCSWYTQMCGLSNVLPVEPDLREKLCDDDALIVDKLVACMADKENPTPMQFFVFHYVYKISKREIARIETKHTKKKCTEGKVRSTLLLMESMVCGMLIQRENMGFKLEFNQ
ncbi:antiterminator Q family protein [Vibrio parahaemolyticus]|uniref:antiterminator Q family protein n=1 Tax=Vibrio parahaemolyticus TaxID=670 RepID=UPI0030075904